MALDDLLLQDADLDASWNRIDDSDDTPDREIWCTGEWPEPIHIATAQFEGRQADTSPTPPRIFETVEELPSSQVEDYIQEIVSACTSKGFRAETDGWPKNTTYMTLAFTYPDGTYSENHVFLVRDGDWLLKFAYGHSDPLLTNRITLFRLLAEAYTRFKGIPFEWNEGEGVS